MIENIINSEVKIKNVFMNIDENAFYFSKKVLDAFHEHGLSEAAFNETTGYGYNDFGRELIEKVYATVFGAEDAIVRNQFVSGSHALSVTLFALLRPGDLLLSVSEHVSECVSLVTSMAQMAHVIKSI